MFRHPTSRENLDAETFLGHEIEVCLSIAVSLEDGNGSYAALSDVMRIPRRYHSGDTRHA
jgi:hypothetical protein